MLSLTILSFNIPANSLFVGFTKMQCTAFENNKKADAKVGEICQDNFVAYIFQGTVIDSTSHQAIAGASVMVNRKTTTVTNSNGYFEFLLAPKYMNSNFKIVVTSIGFRDKKIKIKNKRKTLTHSLTIFLEPSMADLNKVVLTCCD